MLRHKKSPMYVSTTSPNGNAYDFVDYTVPSQTSPLQPQTKSISPPSIDSQLIRKINTLYKSQLLDIEESKDEDNHNEDNAKDNPIQASPILNDTTNQGRPFSKLRKLKTHKTFGGYDEQDGESLVSSPVYDQFNWIMQGFPPIKATISSKQNLTSFVPNTFGSSQYTSDDLIYMLEDPYRSNLQMLKIRVKNRQKIL